MPSKTLQTSMTHRGQKTAVSPLSPDSTLKTVPPVTTTHTWFSCIYLLQITNQRTQMADIPPTVLTTIMSNSSRPKYLTHLPCFSLEYRKISLLPLKEIVRSTSWSEHLIFICSHPNLEAEIQKVQRNKNTNHSCL